MADINWNLSIVNYYWQTLNSIEIQKHDWVHEKWEYKNDKFVCNKCNTTLIKRELMGGYSGPSHYYKYGHTLLRCEDIIMEMICE